MPFSPPLLRRRVLVVEDSEDWQELLATMIHKVPALELSGSVRSAQEAIALFPQVQPDLLILDWHLHDGDGLAVLRLAKRAYPACTVVVFTMSNSPRERARCLAGGADHFVSKAESPQKLALILESGGNPPPRPTS